MHNQKNTVVIVDPYSSSVGLIGEFARVEWDIIAVYISDVQNEHDLCDKEKFSDIIYAPDDYTIVAEKLMHRNVRAVIPGSDMAIRAADVISREIGAPGNDSQTSTVRYDKSAMMETLAAAGIDAPATLRARSLSEACEWARKRNVWPVVLKPAHSAGCDGVFFCDSEEQLVSAWHSVVGTRNYYSFTNDDIVLQECLKGEQYMCNSVSLDGEHYIQSVWREQMFSDAAERPFDYRARLLPPDAPRVREIAEYIRRVLTCLGMQNGPADCELMWSDRGPVLIEINPRLMGGKTSDIEYAANGESHLTAMRDAAVRPHRFNADAQYPFTQELLWLGVAAPYDAHLTPDAVEEIWSLPSVHSVRWVTRADGTVAHTQTFPQLAGHVFFIGDDFEQIQRDSERVRELEATRLYTPIT